MQNEKDCHSPWLYGNWYSSSSCRGWIGRQWTKFDKSMGKVIMLTYRLLWEQMEERAGHQISEGFPNKVNQEKERKFAWEGRTECLKAQREPRTGQKVSKRETSIRKYAYKCFQEFLKRIGLILFFWAPIASSSTVSEVCLFVFLTVVFVLYIVFQSYNILCNILFDSHYQVQWSLHQ